MGLFFSIPSVLRPGKITVNWCWHGLERHVLSGWWTGGTEKSGPLLFPALVFCGVVSRIWPNFHISVIVDNSWLRIMEISVIWFMLVWYILHNSVVVLRGGGCLHLFQMLRWGMVHCSNMVYNLYGLYRTDVAILRASHISLAKLVWAR